MLTGRLCGRRLGDVDAVDQDLTAARPLEPGEHAQGRGLAASGRAEQREELTRLDLQIDSVDGRDAVEVLAQADDRDRAVGLDGSGGGMCHAQESKQWFTAWKETD